MSKKYILKDAINTTALLKEIKIMRSLDHPHVISLIEVYESGKYIHLLLPLLEGGELFK